MLQGITFQSASYKMLKHREMRKKYFVQKLEQALYTAKLVDNEEETLAIAIRLLYKMEKMITIVDKYPEIYIYIYIYLSMYSLRIY